MKFSNNRTKKLLKQRDLLNI